MFSVHESLWNNSFALDLLKERSLHVDMGIPRTKIDKLNWWHGIKLNKRDHRTILPSLFVAFSDRDKNIWQSDREYNNSLIIFHRMQPSLYKESFNS